MRITAVSARILLKSTAEIFKESGKIARGKGKTATNSDDTANQFFKLVHKHSQNILKTATKGGGFPFNFYFVNPPQTKLDYIDS